MEQLEVKAFGFKIGAERNLFHLKLPTLELFPEHLPLFSQKFTLFIACDSRQVSVEVLSHFAEMALTQGAVYICAWGPDCERIHDIFDETIVEQQFTQDHVASSRSVIMTTWHNDETLEDALHYFLTAAIPDDDLAVICHAAIAVSIGNSKWAERIDGAMLSQVSSEDRTYIYTGSPNGQMWMRDDFDEPLEDFADYM